MADHHKDQADHLLPAVYHNKSDEESLQSKEFLWKLPRKLIIGYAVFEFILILVFSTRFLPIAIIDINMNSVTVESFNISSDPSPSLHMKLLSEVAIHNDYFGELKYGNTPVFLYFQGTIAGHGLIPKGHIKEIWTQENNITIDFISENVSSSGNLTLSSYARLNGKEKVMMIFKKSRTAELNCTMRIDLNRLLIQDLNCQRHIPNSSFFNKLYFYVYYACLGFQSGILYFFGSYLVFWFIHVCLGFRSDKLTVLICGLVIVIVSLVSYLVNRV